jgi:hypothetical protein
LDLVEDRWVWVGAVFVSSVPEVQFYKNDGPLGVPAIIGGDGTIGTPDVDYRIANFLYGDADSNLRGYIDQVRVYDDERTEAEMFSDFFNDVADADNLQIGLTLDDVWTDVSGNGNTLTASGMTFTENEVHGYTTSILPTASGLMPGGVSGNVCSNYFSADIVASSAGEQVTYIMRGYDTTLSGTVFWESRGVDSSAASYLGDGPVTDIVVHKIVGE